jgi:hypothetical protein
MPQSIIMAGAFWYFLLPAGAELLGLTALQASLMNLQVSSTACGWGTCMSMTIAQVQAHAQCGGR